LWDATLWPFDFLDLCSACFLPLKLLLTVFELLAKEGKNAVLLGSLAVFVLLCLDSWGAWLSEPAHE
jgi:hypothetical protein